MLILALKDFNGGGGARSDGGMTALEGGESFRLSDRILILTDSICQHKFQGLALGGRILLYHFSLFWKVR